METTEKGRYGGIQWKKMYSEENRPSEAGIRGNEAKTERRTGQETELNLQWRYGL